MFLDDHHDARPAAGFSDDTVTIRRMSLCIGPHERVVIVEKIFDVIPAQVVASDVVKTTIVIVVIVTPDQVVEVEIAQVIPPSPW